MTYILGILFSFLTLDKMENKPNITKEERSLSEEFNNQSPFTQQYIKSLVGGTTPTSKPRLSITENPEEFTSESPNTQTNIKFWLGIK
jgi:hypothetical protein